MSLWFRQSAFAVLQRALNLTWRIDWLGLAAVALVFFVPYWIFKIYLDVVLAVP